MQLKRAEAGFKLLEERIKAAEGTNRQLIVLSHYPTTWFKYGGFTVRGKGLLDLLKNPKVKITYFGGHVHATDNKTNVSPEMRRHGWNDYCVVRSATAPDPPKDTVCRVCCLGQTYTPSAVPACCAKRCHAT